jgi:TonB-linked SusC/RagA family outer membrane protein
MKPHLLQLFAFLIISCCLPQGSARAADDQQPLPLADALEELETRYAVTFAYENLVVAGKTVTLPHDGEAPLEEVLANLLGEHHVDFERVSTDYVVLSRLHPARRRPTPALSPRPIVRQLPEIRRAPRIPMRTIMGTVTDETGLGIIGANIRIPNTSTGTVTDLEGSFTLSVPDQTTSLLVSYLGYAPQEVDITNRTQVDVVLLEDNSVLSEVVVVGYGSTRREAVTGAVSSIDADAASALTVNNVGEALQGRLAGVQVINTGAPGTEPNIQVRGVGSINFGSGPLYVVDGIPEAGGLNEFDTRDIASITALKDASATAVYGSRGSNGVILIETKSGPAEEGIELNFHSTVGIQTQPERFDLLTTEQYIPYAETFLGGPLTFLDEPTHEGADRTFREVDTDWQDEMYQTGLITQNTLQLGGKKGGSRYFSSIGYMKQEGVMLNTPFERYNFRLNSTHEITGDGKLTFGQTLYGARYTRENESRLAGASQLQQIAGNFPYLPVFDPTHVGGYAGTEAGRDGGSSGNPVFAARLLENRDNVLRLLGTAYLDYAPTEGLNLRILYGGNYGDLRTSNREPIYESTQIRNENTIRETSVRSYSPLYRAQASYDKLLGDHSLNATVVGEIQETYVDLLRAQSSQATNDINVVSGGANPEAFGERSKEVLQSFVARATYGFRGKYYLTASFRRDGSSIFAPGNQRRNFPALALGWNISEEGFMADTPLSLLKLRASYGRTGSIGLGPYSFQAPISANPGPLFGISNSPIATAINSLPNGNLEWETTDMLNAGLDFGFLQNRLNFSVEYYDREVDNLILDINLPGSVGIPTTVQNIGAMRNAGLEFQGQIVGNPAGRFRWDLSLNVSRNTNEVLRLARPGEEILANNDERYTAGFPSTITRVGDPIFSFYGWETAGLFQNQAEIDEAPSQPNAAPGDVRFVDQNGDGVIDTDDRVVLGSYLPDFTYGANFNARYANFDFNVFLAGSQGNDIYNGMQVLLTQTARLNNSSIDILDAWTPTNTDTDIPRVAAGDPNRNHRVSDRFLEDGSYLRLRALTVGYRLPLAAGSTLSNLRVYFTGQNLLTLTGYSGLSPEIAGGIGATGFDDGQYPQARSFLLGLQIGL